MTSRSRGVVGRAQVLRSVGRARAGPVVEPPADRTAIMRLGDDLPPPVFADASGRRRRRVRWVAYGLGVLALLLVAAFWLSQAGDPVNPAPVSPCPTGTALGGKNAPPATAGGCAAVPPGEGRPTTVVRDR